MSLKKWAVKQSELRLLDGPALLLFGARCALRVEPWLAPASQASFREALEIVLAAAEEEETPIAVRHRAGTVKRALSDSGAISCNALDGTEDEALGRCMNHAAQSLVLTLDAAELHDLTDRKKTIIDVAKNAASIPPVLAHAGLIVAKSGDAVTESATTIWKATRSDISVLASRPAVKLTVAKLRGLAPLWPDGPPRWLSRKKAGA
jgi:hypothetical protein